MRSTVLSMAPEAELQGDDGDVECMRPSVSSQGDTVLGPSLEFYDMLGVFLLLCFHLWQAVGSGAILAGSGRGDGERRI